jgi:hypothetical protein
MGNEAANWRICGLFHQSESPVRRSDWRHDMTSNNSTLFSVVLAILASSLGFAITLL